MRGRIVAAAFLNVWRNALATARIDLVLGTDGSEAVNRTFWVAAQRMHLPLLFCTGAGPLDRTMQWDRTVMVQSWVDRNMIANPRPESLEYARKFLATTRTHEPVIGGSRPSMFNRERIRLAVRYWRGRRFGAGGPVDSHPIGYAFAQLFKASYANIRSRRLVQPTPAAPFFFLPLHVPNDAQITVRHPEYVHQADLVRLVAAALPSGVSLVVKEHPHAVGAMGYAQLREMAEIPNVKVVAAALSAHALIRQSVGVVTLNSDVGWEAILWGKPVVVIGRPFYDIPPYAIRAHDGQDLSTALVAALKQEPTKDTAILALVAAVKDSSYDGSFFKAGSGTELDDSKENGRLLAAGVLAAVKRFYPDLGAKAAA